MRGSERLPVCVDDAHDEGTTETTRRQRQPPRCGGRPLGSRFVGTPRLGVGTSEMGRDDRLGLLGGADPAFALGVEAERRERPLPGGTDHGALARATVRW